MILLPQRLFADPQVATILRDGHLCILRKELKEPILQREGYISNHLIAILLEGEQRIQRCITKTSSTDSLDFFKFPVCHAC